ncbi:MAG: class I SAM-dependent methyltransferase [Candidatus Bipolaricaulia bacterium]
MKMGKIEKWFVNSPGHSKQVGRRAERLLGLVNAKPGQSYLDVGTGNGAAPIYIARKHDLNVIGIDVDPEQIRIAQENSKDIDNARFLMHDATQLPFQGNEFDIVSTNKVTHHIPNWEDALAEMIRVLKPNGYLIYSDLVYPKWIASIGKRVTKNRAGFPTIGALNSFAKKNKLSIVHLSKSPVHYEAVFRKPTDLHNQE